MRYNSSINQYKPDDQEVMPSPGMCDTAVMLYLQWDLTTTNGPHLDSCILAHWYISFRHFINSHMTYHCHLCYIYIYILSMGTDTSTW